MIPAVVFCVLGSCEKTPFVLAEVSSIWGFRTPVEVRIPRRDLYKLDARYCDD